MFCFLFLNKMLYLFCILNEKKLNTIALGYINLGCLFVLFLFFNYIIKNYRERHKKIYN